MSVESRGTGTSGFDGVSGARVSASDNDFEEPQLVDNYKKILAIDFRFHKLGGCFYSHEDQKLLVIEDTTTNSPDIYLESVLFQLSPTVVAVSSSIDDRIAEVLNKNQKKFNYNINIRPSREFSSKNGSNYVLPFANSSVAMVSCSALLGLLETSVLLKDPSTDVETILSSFEPFILNDYLFIDEDSLYALKIFPCSKNDFNADGGKSSVYDILNLTGSESGSALLKIWLLRPLSDLEKINKRLDTISILTKQEYSDEVEDLMNLVKSLNSATRLVLALKSGKSNYNTWLKLYNFILNSYQIFQKVSSLIMKGENCEIFEKISTRIDPSKLSELLNTLQVTVDFDDSKLESRVTVLDGFDSQLDEYRKTYNEMEAILQMVASELSKDMAPDLAKLLNVVYIPQLGYLVSIENQNSKIENIAVKLGWNEVFRTSTTIYYKNYDMEEMDGYYGDIYTLMCDCEIEILYNVQKKILKHEKTLTEITALLSELDCFLALSKAALMHKYVKPEMTDDISLDIEESRHPVYETLVPSFVPNDAKLNTGDDDCNDFERIMLLTGANFSGKSIYLTQVALIVYLSHVGCFVPAKKAKIGICDKILTRIMSRESVSRQQSTFMADAQQMSKCLKLMSKKSLLIIDEFGKGTDINDGPALFGSVLKYLSSLNNNCPRSIAATHFHELLSNTSLKKILNLNHVHYYNMEILITKDYDTSLGKQSDQITYLYQLKEGLAGGSFGIFCAKNSGIDNNIIERAEFFVSLFEKGDEIDFDCYIKIDSDYQKRLKKAEDITRKFIIWDLDEDAQDIEVNLGEKLEEILD
ncbi:hypothetical protein PACTADRAFT_82311 [Pachysolen tannophilus NRRL Y-2460]|uniref:DNA mismatch repair proteins mutS family domain-containing protein n=1 Tax=Pachysolen tannophilus NRRL Y-2460 TaxID=669874 RepID=A0A1E4TPX9_PACTA|nr:hypothetical protein PACTADRAFT_82311 [Pachysolen tannophilus NRRL Y-2460]